MNIKTIPEHYNGGSLLKTIDFSGSLEYRELPYTKVFKKTKNKESLPCFTIISDSVNDLPSHFIK